MGSSRHWGRAANASVSRWTDGASGGSRPPDRLAAPGRPAPSTGPMRPTAEQHIPVVWSPTSGVRRTTACRPRPRTRARDPQPTNGTPRLPVQRSAIPHCHSGLPKVPIDKASSPPERALRHRLPLHPSSPLSPPRIAEGTMKQDPVDVTRYCLHHKALGDGSVIDSHHSGDDTVPRAGDGGGCAIALHCVCTTGVV